ncbi:MAG: O-antigen ligase family protein [Chloroflexota bacterium]|nr:O-antigen ligase family protein [Chloroflexota bacterium]
MSIRTITQSSQYYRKRNTRRILFLGLVCLVLTGILAKLVTSNPLIAIVLLAIILIIALIIRWPSVGYSMAVLIVLPCELFTVPDGISTYSNLPVANLNSYTPLSISASALELILIVTILITVIKASIKGERFLDRSKTALAVGLFGGFLIFGYLWGVYVRRGDGKVAQTEIRSILFVILLYFLTIYFVRDSKMWRTLNWIYPLGLSLMAIIGILRFFTIDPAIAGPIYAESLNGFNHDTSILFVILVMWCLAKLVFGDNKGEKFIGWVLLAPAFFGIFVSGRRSAFAVLAGCIIIFLAMLFVRHRKAFIIIVIILGIIGPPYMVVFSKVSGPLGMPARAFSSTSAAPGSRDANSDLYRTVEKNNVIMTIKTAPLTGIGFGQPFIRFIEFIDLEGFTLQNYTPHVQVLWLWLKVGMFGWGIFWLILCSSLFKLGQVIKYGKPGLQMTLSITAGSTITSIMIYSYLDVGLLNTRLMTLLGISVGLLELAYRTIEPFQPKESHKKPTNDKIR